MVYLMLPQILSLNPVVTPRAAALRTPTLELVLNPPKQAPPNNTSSNGSSLTSGTHILMLTSKAMLQSQCLMLSELWWNSSSKYPRSQIYRLSPIALAIWISREELVDCSAPCFRTRFKGSRHCCWIIMLNHTAATILDWAPHTEIF